MRLLLDTHSYLWWLAADDRLSDEARRAVEDVASTIYISAATIWEASIKSAARRLDVRGDLVLHIGLSNFSPLSISVEHAVAAAALPLHHRDPFDRMLVAQARVENLTLVTRDPRFAAYDVAVFPA